MAEIIDIGDRARELPRNGGNGGSFEKRLRVVELDVREIKTTLKNVATKGDIDKLKIWALGGALAGTSGAILWLVRLLS